ncbi:MAG TPA: hypothetical protein VMT94_05155 [Burkholderiales bacterium]|nr:hypothetical protein [Burkholderiales bacterium]
MRNRDATLILTAAAVLIGTAAATAHAADRDREALKRMQQNVARLQSENASLQQDKDQMTAKLDADDKELTDLRKVKKRATALKKEVDWLTAENGDLKSQLDAAQKDLADTTKQWQDDHARGLLIMGNLKSSLAEERGDRMTCQANNLKLRNLAHEILDRYQNKGVFEGLLQREPFTQIKSVEIENLVQDYGEKIDDLGVKER